MRIHDQNREMKAEITNLEQDITDLYAAIVRKMSSPYPDGSYGDQINANTDVIPQILSMRSKIGDLQERISQ